MLGWVTVWLFVHPVASPFTMVQSCGFGSGVGHNLGDAVKMVQPRALQIKCAKKNLDSSTRSLPKVSNLCLRVQ